MAKKKTSSKKQTGGVADTLWGLAARLLAEIGIHAVDRLFDSTRSTKLTDEEFVPEQPQKRKRATKKPKTSKIIKMPPPWWKVLGIPETSTKSEIKKAYREQMMLTHPDKVAHLSKKLQRAAELEAKKLNQAYEDAVRFCERAND